MLQEIGEDNKEDYDLGPELDLDPETEPDPKPDSNPLSTQENHQT